MGSTMKFNVVVIFADELRTTAKALQAARVLATAKPKPARKLIAEAYLTALSRMYNTLHAIMDNPSAPILVLEMAQGDARPVSGEEIQR